MFCSEHVAQLRTHEEEFSKKGASLAAVGLGDMSYAKFFREKTGIDFPLLVDEKREAYKAIELKNASLLHLLRRDNMQARKRAQAAGHKQHKLGKDPFQLGGSFVFAPGNKDLFVHVSETFGDNASPKDILAALG
ncbi:MAG TPA: peroxiredoxin-like family protein [Candidatus Angelobacter sp.]|nr:peroxiredoxin-like family protein [Candidatus Angelobacter sp.]